MFSLFNVCQRCFQRLRPFYYAANPIISQTRNKTYTKKLVRPPSVAPLNQDVLVFVHKRRSHIGAAMGCLVGLSVFLLSTGSNFDFIGEELKLRKKRLTTEKLEEEKAKRSYFDIYKFKDGVYHHAIALLFYGLAALTLTGIIVIPPRYIKSIVLMKDRTHVCLSTYAPFGSTKHILRPVTEVSAVHKYASGKTAWVKVKKYKIPFYVSGTGEVLNSSYLTDILTQRILY